MKKWAILFSMVVCMFCLCSCTSMQKTEAITDTLDLDYISTGKPAVEEAAKDDPWYTWIKNAFSFGPITTTENKTEEKPNSVAEFYSQGTVSENSDVHAKEDTEEMTETVDEPPEMNKTDNKPWYQRIKDDQEKEEKQPEQEDRQDDPVQEPVEETKSNTVTMHIRCDTAVKNGMHLESKWAGIVPASGIILDTTEFEIKEGETVFDVLCKARDKYKLHMEYSGAGSGIYVEGINNLYEFDGGRWSGWMYCVNGWYPNYGCGVYYLQPGDVIEWNYTCDLGCDLENGDPYGYGKDWKDTHD